MPDRDARGQRRQTSTPLTLLRFAPITSRLIDTTSADGTRSSFQSISGSVFADHRRQAHTELSCPRGRRRLSPVLRDRSSEIWIYKQGRRSQPSGLALWLLLWASGQLKQQSQRRRWCGDEGEAVVAKPSPQESRVQGQGPARPRSRPEAVRLPASAAEMDQAGAGGKVVQRSGQRPVRENSSRASCSRSRSCWLETDSRAMIPIP